MERDDTAWLVFVAPIEDETVQRLAHSITQIPKHISTLHILISTAGGSISSALALYAILRALPHQLIMHNIGSVDSAGIIVFLAASKRYAAPHASFLIHGAKYPEEKGGEPSCSTLRERLSWLEGEQQRMQSILTSRTDISPDALTFLFDRGELKSAEYALQHALIEEIREAAFPPSANVIVVRTPEPS